MGAEQSSGLIQIYTGNGKGKTTASLGLALRARAVGKRVAIVFFDKGGEHYSERKLLGELGVTWFACGLDRIDPTSHRFRFGVIPEDLQQAGEGIAKARALFTAQPPYDLVILDEINTTVALGMLAERAVEDLMDAKPTTMELVCTGRTEIAKGAASPPGKPWTDGNERQRWLSYFDRADLMTDMRLVKHYFYFGVPAREGIDY